MKIHTITKERAEELCLFYDVEVSEHDIYDQVLTVYETQPVKNDKEPQKSFYNYGNDVIHLFEIVPSQTLNNIYEES